MPLFNEDLFHDEWANNSMFRTTVIEFLGRNHQFLEGVKADRSSALKALYSLRHVLVTSQRQMHKYLRPWDVSSKVLNHLDRNEPWWGFEFETGWVSADARGEALAFTYDNIDGVMYDGEGEGFYPVEITFLPEERSKYLDGTSSAHKFIRWMNDNPQLIYLSGINDVGTHLNMSHKKIETHAQAVELSKFLNRTLHQTVKVDGQRKEMFGRETIYAGFFAQFGGDKAWVEFKGYRTAYTLEEFEKYIKSAEALQKCVDLFIDRTRACDMMCVGNLYDVAFNEAEPELVPWVGPLQLGPRSSKLCSRYAMGPL